jgi:hypothetical protein
MGKEEKEIMANMIANVSHKGVLPDGYVFTDPKKQFYQDLINMSEELGNVRKNKKGYGYTYADLGSILEYVKPIIAKHNFALLQTVGSYIPTDSKEPMIKIKTDLIHLSGESIWDEMILPPTPVKGANATQAIGASITYARRYSIGAILGISTDEDTDGLTKQEIVEKEKGSPVPAQSQQSSTTKKRTGTLNIARQIVKNGWLNGEYLLDDVKKLLNEYSWTKQDHEYIKGLLAKETEVKQEGTI